mgnify:FL=1
MSRRATVPHGGSVDDGPARREIEEIDAEDRGRGAVVVVNQDRGVAVREDALRDGEYSDRKSVV